MRWLVDLAPKKACNKPVNKIDVDVLKKDIVAYSDSYQYERADPLGVRLSGIYWALKRLGVTYKKTPIYLKADDDKRLLF